MAAIKACIVRVLGLWLRQCDVRMTWRRWLCQPLRYQQTAWSVLSILVPVIVPNAPIYGLADMQKRLYVPILPVGPLLRLPLLHFFLSSPWDIPLLCPSSTPCRPSSDPPLPITSLCSADGHSRLQVSISSSVPTFFQPFAFAPYLFIPLPLPRQSLPIPSSSHSLLNDKTN